MLVAFTSKSDFARAVLSWIGAISGASSAAFQTDLSVSVVSVKG
jgi:hypothetical protein